MKRPGEQSLYEVLEVPPDAPAEEIEKAYARAKALYGIATYSLLPADESAELDARIEEARTVLLDPAARWRYDEELAAAAAPRTTRGNGSPPVIPPLAPKPIARAATPAPLPSVQVTTPLGGEAAPAPPVNEPATDLHAGPVSPAHPIPLRAEVPAAPAPQAPPAPVPVPLTTTAATPVPARPAPPREAPQPEASSWSGEVLRKLREARGITVQQLAERTKVTRHHIENIEADRFGVLPASVYLRGILMSIARELRLDGQKVARSYLDRMAAERAGPPGPARR